MRANRWQIAWAKANPDRVAEYRREWKKRNPEAAKAWNRRYPEKRRAQNLLWKAILSGKIVRPTICQECGQEGRVEAHHPDYSKPFEVLWLCNRDHVAAHRGGE